MQTRSRPKKAPFCEAVAVDEGEARRLLGGISARMMLKLRAAGQLKAVRIGRRVMYAPDDLRAFIAANRE